MVNLGCQQLSIQKRHSEHKDFLKSTTYLAKIALILQDTPDKMLTFSQLIYRLAPLIPESRKSVEGNIRVCLSSNKCFVKIPMTPGSQDSKKNYWKLDPQHITEKMVRRHFRGILELFPELVSKVQTPAPSSHQRPTACKAPAKPEVKFRSPFSIESLLRRDSRYVWTPRPSALSTVPFRGEQPRPSLGGVQRSYTYGAQHLERSFNLSTRWPVGGSTYRGLESTGAESVIKSHELSYPVFISGASTAAFLSSDVTYASAALSHGPVTSWV